MRRHFIFGILITVILSSCAAPERLPIDEVMALAARANQDIQSASFIIDGSYSIPLNMLGGAISGDASMEGTLQDGGEYMQVSIQTEAIVSGVVEDTNAQVDFEVITTPHDETFIKINKLDTQPTYPLLVPLMINNLIGRWWEFPNKNTEPRDIMTTPDPRLLQAQSKVVSVIGDLGLDTIRGRSVYHYQVEVDREKLYDYLITLSEESAQDKSAADISAMLDGLNALGELWIDAESYYLQRIIWSVETVSPDSDEKMVITFTMDLMDHNESDPIVLPTDTDLFTVEELMPSLDSSPTSSFDGFPSELENDIIEKLLEETQSATPSP
ncbi:MAG: hypothetical protein K9M03_03675 [Kiritimatiellales bacterium]|nr:hypothetical protein [Kiritimatiellales bacterium]